MVKTTDTLVHITVEKARCEVLVLDHGQFEHVTFELCRKVGVDRPAHAFYNDQVCSDCGICDVLADTSQI